MKYRHLSSSPSRRAQQGSVAVVFALSLVALLGFAGLAVDGGRLYVIKTELQNAADACALAAAQELEGPIVAAGASNAAFKKAEAAGVRVAQGNKVDLQSAYLPDATVRFTNAADAPESDWRTAEAAAVTDRFAVCKVERIGISPWFITEAGLRNIAVKATAMAVRDLSANNCAPLPGTCSAVASLVM